MTILMTMITRDGIVMAADSLGTSRDPETGKIIFQSKNIQKIFLSEQIGISTCGHIFNINEYRELIQDIQKKEIQNPYEICQMIINHFSCEESYFIVCGYIKIGGEKIPKIYEIDLKNKDVQDKTYLKILCKGTNEPFGRLFYNVGIKKDDGTYQDIPNFNLNLNTFALNDSVQFIDFVYDTTRKMEHFRFMEKSIGGDMDILWIYPSGIKWIRNKKENIL